METFVCKGKRRKRKNVVVTLDSEIVKKAKELGLNIFRVCENAFDSDGKRLRRHI